MAKSKANIGGFFNKFWSTWFVENTNNTSLDNTDNVYHNGNVGIGDFSGQNVGDNLEVLTDGGGGVTISNSGTGQTSPFLTFNNVDNASETILTPRDGSVLNVEYPESTQYFAIDEDGQIQADFYGNGALTGNPAFDLQVDSAGNFIEVPIQSDSVSSVTQQAIGHEIATHDDGNGTVISIQETITQLVEPPNTNFISLIKEDGSADLIDLNRYLGPWDDLNNNTPADQASANIQYTDGNVTVGSWGQTLGSESTFQAAADQSGEGFLQTPWLYSNAIEAPTEKGAASTLIVLGEDGNFNPTDDTISFITEGNVRLVVKDSGEIRFDEYGVGTFDDPAPVRILGVKSDGDVVEVDPTSLGTDDQTLSVGTAVDGSTNSITISNGNTIPLVHPPQVNPTLTATRESIIVGHASGYQSGTTTLQSRNATITRNGVGIYTVAFTNPHPDGTNYEILFGGHEDTNRDVPKVWAREGSLTANGFIMEVTLDDNGGTADVRTDEPFSFEVLREIDVITNLAATGITLTFN